MSRLNFNITLSPPPFFPTARPILASNHQPCGSPFFPKPTAPPPSLLASLPLFSPWFESALPSSSPSPTTPSPYPASSANSTSVIPLSSQLPSISSPYPVSLLTIHITTITHSTTAISPPLSPPNHNISLLFPFPSYHWLGWGCIRTKLPATHTHSCRVPRGSQPAPSEISANKETPCPVFVLGVVRGG